MVAVVMMAATLAADDRFHCKSFPSEQERNATKRYWITRGLAEAVPMRMPVDPPLEGSKAPAFVPRPRTFAFFGRLVAPAGSGIAHVDETLLPYSAGGKLSFDDADGIPTWCSATLIERGAGGSLIITAAHCVRNRDGRDHTSLAFVRAHDKDGATGQLFAVVRAGSPEAWVTAPNEFRQFDYAILKLDATASVHLPLTTSASSFASWASLGYPMPGDSMKRDDGTRGTTAGNVTEMLDNSMAHGTSGGPWIAALTEGLAVGNEVVGINAAKTASTVTIGPVIRQEIFDLLAHVEAGCPQEDE